MRTLDRYSDYPASAVDEISVLSWNVLAPSYDRNCMDWEGTRLPELKRWLQRFAACDLICLQEVDVSKSLSLLCELFGQAGFEAVVQDRKGFEVVNVTFLKASRLRLLHAQHRSRTLVVSVALPDGRELSIANVHLEAGGGVKNEKQRAAQLQSVLKRLSGSVVVCGDFNSQVSDGSQLRTQLVEADLARAPTKGITLAQKSGYADTLDHIFASRDMKVRLVLGSSPEVLEKIATEGMPDAAHPSDHLPVAATFSVGRAAQRSNSTSAPAVEEPSCPAEEMRREWQQICWHAPISRDKRMVREHRQIEAAFLELVTDVEAANLQQWREAAAKAAKSIVAGAVGAAVVAARAAQADSPTSKPFDPGVSEAIQKVLGGA